MENVLNCLYKISSDIHVLLNGKGNINNTLFWSRGKIFGNEIDVETFGGEPIVGNEDNDSDMIDCRFECVDLNMKRYIRERIYNYVSDFYSQKENNDEFLLLLGFSINLYYVVGLYSVFGKFEIEKILKNIEEERVKDYAVLINEYLHSLIVNMIGDRIQLLELDNVELYNEVVEQIGNKDLKVDIENLQKSVKEVDKNYIPDIYMRFYENDFNKKPNEILTKMISRYPDYRFGWIYKCLDEGVEFYKSKGNQIRVYEYRNKLGVELFLHVIGVKTLDSGKYDVVDEKIETIRPVIFSEFGIGIPKIKTISKDKYYLKSNCSMFEDENKKNKISYRTIRKQTETTLKIDFPVSIEDNPLRYMGKLFETIEGQKSELREKNIRLENLHEQRRNMIGHLAHSWGNECYPEIVKKVADELLKKGNSSLANRLFKAYNSENNLMGEIIFLQAAMDDEPERLKKIFKDSFYISGDGKEEWKILTLIEEALEILVFGLMNYDGDKQKRRICQNKLCVKHTLSELVDDYVKRFEEGKERKSFLKWFNDNIFLINFYIDETWKSINFGKTEYGKIVIKNIFTELFTNVLYHGKDGCDITLQSDFDKMYLIVSNKISENETGSGKGLQSMKEIVAKLNYNTKVTEDECIEYCVIKDTIFQTKITFDKELMYIDEEW